MPANRLARTAVRPAIMIKQSNQKPLESAYPRPENTTVEQFGSAAEELFNRIMQLTDNAGATDEHRALNYLAMRYSAIYAKAAEEFGRDFSLSAVEVRPSPLSGTRHRKARVYGKRLFLLLALGQRVRLFCLYSDRLLSRLIDPEARRANRTPIGGCAQQV